MKIFENVLKHLEAIGFKENQNPFNRRQFELGLITIFDISLLCLYLLFVADTPGDFINGAFWTIIAVLFLVSHVSTVFETAAIFAFINQLNEIIGQRK